MTAHQEQVQDGRAVTKDHAPNVFEDISKAMAEVAVDCWQAAKTLADPNEPLRLQNETAEQKGDICKTEISESAVMFMAWKGDEAREASFRRMMASVETGVGLNNLEEEESKRLNLHDYRPEPARAYA